jgi:hypothetical protein
VAHGIWHGGEEGVLLPDGGLEGGDFFGDGGVVSDDKVEGFFVFGEDDGVGGVFVAGTEVLDELEVVVLVVSVGVADAIDAFHGGHVEAVEGVEEAEGAADFAFAPVDGEVGEAFEGLDRDGAFFLREGDAKDAFVVLVGDDEAAFGIEGHGDPGALGGRDFVEEFGVEAVLEGDAGVLVGDEFWGGFFGG